MRRTDLRQPGARGFTLIEVVVALAIVALALAAILPGFGTALRLGDAAESERTAMLTAQSLLDRLAADSALTAGIREGGAGTPTPWRAVIAPMPADPDEQGRFTPHLTPLKATVTVFDNDSRPRAILTTVLLGRGT